MSGTPGYLLRWAALVCSAATSCVSRGPTRTSDAPPSPKRVVTATPEERGAVSDGEDASVFGKAAIDGGAGSCSIFLSGGVVATLSCSVKYESVARDGGADLNTAHVIAHAKEGDPRVSIWLVFMGRPTAGTPYSSATPQAFIGEAEVEKDGVEWTADSARHGSFAVSLTTVHASRTARRPGLEVHGTGTIELVISNVAAGYSPAPVRIRAHF